MRCFGLLLVLRRSPPRFALLAKAGDAFNRFRRMAASVEVTLQLGQQLFRDRRLAQPAHEPLAVAAAFGPASNSSLSGPPTPHPHRNRRVHRPAGPHRCFSREALARQQIAAQAAMVDGTQKE